MERGLEDVEDETERDSAHPAILRKQELAEYATSSGAPGTVFEQFIDKVKQIREFYKKYPGQLPEDLEMEYKMRRAIKEGTEDIVGDAGSSKREREQVSRTQKLLSAFGSGLMIENEFTGEEVFGRFLDLVTLHERFNNLRFVENKVSYVEYLGVFYKFDEASVYKVSRLRDADYFSYVADLHDYLKGYFRRSRILSRPDDSLAQIEADFDRLWESGELQTSSVGETNSTEEDPLFCKACGKKFASQSVYDAHLSGRKHKKNVELQKSLDTPAQTTSSVANGAMDLKTRAVLFHEYGIKALADLVQKQIDDTIANVERRRALTDRERQLEIEAMEREILGPDELSESGSEDGDGSDDESDDGLYNPLKLPLGYDGKPIPYWLWKLNGLGIEYKCEICGNYTYMGRRAFERHFLEGRHTHGLRCLGIQPSTLFKNITSIDEAVALWEKVKAEEQQKEAKPENTIEMEDDEGNVMSEKVYNDLKKQGLI